MHRISSRPEAPQVISTVALGFAADPFVRWFYPDAAEFMQHFPRVVELYGGHAFEAGSAWRSDDYAASALWLPPEVHPDGDGLVAWLQETVAPEKHDALMATIEQMDVRHPTVPCWHLAFIAVDPARQGKGLGTALLRESLRKCDEAGLPAYLESTNPANLSLYRRHGFEDAPEIRAEGAPPLYPMLRPPH